MVQPMSKLSKRESKREKIANNGVRLVHSLLDEASFARGGPETWL